MTFTHALATNNYGPAKFIVDASAANGTHTTIAAALTSSTSGDTIFLRPGTYTENLTLKAGVNLVAYVGDGSTPNVTIIGTATLTAAGSVSITGVRLQTNSAAALAVTGTVASVVFLEECDLNFTNNTGITFSTSSASGRIFIKNCTGNLGTTGIAIWAHTSAGAIVMQKTNFTNTGASTTASNNSAGSVEIDFCFLAMAFSTSGTTATIVITYSNINTTAINTINLTHASTSAVNSIVDYCGLLSGTASTLSISAGATLVINECRIDSSNTNAVTGAGTVQYGLVTFTNTSNTINTTTQLALITRYGFLRSTLTPSFLATHTVAQDNVTGNGAAVTVNYTTEVFDQNNNYDGTNTFTAPVTGRYFLHGNVFVTGAGTSTNGNGTVVTSNRSYQGYFGAPAPLVTLDTYVITTTTLADMDTADTATFSVTVNGMAGNTADLPIAAGISFFSGYLQC